MVIQEETGPLGIRAGAKREFMTAAMTGSIRTSLVLFSVTVSVGVPF